MVSTTIFCSGASIMLYGVPWQLSILSSSATALGPWHPMRIQPGLVLVDRLGWQVDEGEDLSIRAHHALAPGNCFGLQDHAGHHVDNRSNLHELMNLAWSRNSCFDCKENLARMNYDKTCQPVYLYHGFQAMSLLQLCSAHAIITWVKSMWCSLSFHQAVALACPRPFACLISFLRFEMNSGVNMSS